MRIALVAYRDRGDAYVTQIHDLTARQRGIVINTVQCGGLAETTPIWQQIAASGGGMFAAIRRDGGMLAPAIRIDDEALRAEPQPREDARALRRAGGAG